MFRLLVAVVFGYFLIGLLVVATDQVFTLVIPGFVALKEPPASYFLISLLTDSLYSVVGGYVCAFIAKARAPQAVLALMIVGEVIGAMTQVSLWKVVPHWFGLGLLAFYPVGVWLGARLGRIRIR